MRSLRVLALALLLAAAIGAPPLDAARDPAAHQAGRRLEVIVLEVRNCYVCELVRFKVQPLYEQSLHARGVPLRYVDITGIDEMQLGLKDKVRTVPTIVLMQDGEEVDRITGYMAPDVTLRALSQMIANAD